MELIFDISEDERPVFLSEADENLQILDENLVELERSNGGEELLQTLFRAAHTLKGMAGVINHRRMTNLTHALEAALDGLRKNTIQVSTPLVDLCLESVDGLRSLRSEVVTGKACDLDVDRLIEDFQTYLGAQTKKAPLASPPAASVPTAASAQPALDQPVRADGRRVVHFHAAIDQNSIASAARAFQLMMVLQDVGEIVSLTPPLEHIEAAQSVQEFSAEVLTAVSDEQILKSAGLISEVERCWLNGPAPAPVVPPPPPAAEMTAAEPPQKAGLSSGYSYDRRKTSRRSEMTVRTSVERLDNLMNLVGELITDRNHLLQIRGRMEAEKKSDEQFELLYETVSHLGRITDHLQEEVMQIRMLPISNVLSRFPRMVRDMSKKTGKLIDLVIQGEDTELDRSVIEEINDPLIHLVRNSIDHGIETPEQRLAAGKPERGTITMTARHEQGRIILTIADDGAGIDTVKVRRSAVQKGIVTEEEAAAMTEEQAVDLIFAPGLSTAQKVTDISGRGVGMDIVHTNIQRVNGTIQVETHPGKGSAFHVSLPLTLAIVPSLMVKVASTVYAIPLVMVTETLRLTEADIHSVRGKPVTLLRGNVLPLIKLTEVFDHQSAAVDSKYNYAVVVHSGKLRIGLIVDTLTGEEEIVVKSLGPLIGEVPGISSAAILGDGTVALIIDVPGLFRAAGIH